MRVISSFSVHPFSGELVLYAETPFCQKTERIPTGYHVGRTVGTDLGKLVIGLDVETALETVRDYAAY